jgi:hypothetical protein
MPLAHLLAPQIMRKAEELEAELGRTPPGYLRASTPTPAPLPLASSGGTLMPVTDVPDDAPKAKKAKKLPKGVIAIPTDEQEPIGSTEDGRPIYISPPAAPEPKLRKAGKRVIISAPTAMAVGTNEQGEATNIRGRNLGYMAQQNVPEIQTTERRPSHVWTRDESLIHPDAFARQVLEQRFGKHLKAQEDNLDPRKPTAFPLGYFNSMQPYEQQEIEEGTARLRELKRGTGG